MNYFFLRSYEIILDPYNEFFLSVHGKITVFLCVLSLQVTPMLRLLRQI